MGVVAEKVVAVLAVVGNVGVMVDAPNLTTIPTTTGRAY